MSDHTGTTETVAQRMLREAGISTTTTQKASWYVAFCNANGREPSREEMQEWSNK